MGGKSKAPPAPDYKALAQEQAKLNAAALQQQTVANRPNQTNALGSLTWTQDPTTGQWTQTESLNPAVQALLDKSLGLQGQSIDQVQALMNQGGFSGGPAMPTYQQYGVEVPTYDQAAGNAYADQFTQALLARVTPQQGIDRERMETQLRLKGLQPGTEAYDRAYKNLLTAQGDVNAQATLQGQLAGQQEARNIYDTQLKGYQQGFTNNINDYLTQLQGQQQGYTQSLQNYLLPWQTAAANQGLANNVTMPTFQNFATAGQQQTPDMLGTAQQQYAQQMQAYNDKKASKEGKGKAIGTVVGGVAGAFLGPGGIAIGSQLGGAAGGAIASDAMLKNTIVPLSDEECYNKMVELVPVSWKWNGTGVSDSGIIAQEVMQLIPEVVGRHAAGHLVVGYTQLFAILLGAFRHLAKKEAANADA